MPTGRDPNDYREEAARYRRLVPTVKDSPALRDSYLALAVQYERLADVLDAGLRPVGVEPKRGRSVLGDAKRFVQVGVLELRILANHNPDIGVELRRLADELEATLAEWR